MPELISPPGAGASPVAVVGLDLSLRSTGIAYADGAARRLRTWRLRGPERLAYVRAAVLEAAQWAELVMIESYAWTAPGRSTISLGELGGVIRCSLWLAGLPFYEVTPASLKLFATGDGSAAKPAVVEAAQRHLGYGGQQHDEADALWLRALGRALVGWPVTLDLPPENLAALDAVRKRGAVTGSTARPVADVATGGRL